MGCEGTISDELEAIISDELEATISDELEGTISDGPRRRDFGWAAKARCREG
jgi:hypothetical protein